MTAEQRAVHEEKIRKQQEKQAERNAALERLDQAKKAAEEEANRGIAELNAKRGLSREGRLKMPLRENTGVGMFELLLDAHVASIEATLACAHEMADNMRRELVTLERRGAASTGTTVGVISVDGTPGKAVVTRAPRLTVARAPRQAAARAPRKEITGWRDVENTVSSEAFATRAAYDELIEAQYKREALQQQGPTATLFDAMAARIRAQLTNL
jgi:hypothetical protein